MTRFFSVEIIALSKGVAYSLILGLISAVVIYYTPLSEMLLPSISKIILIICIFYMGSSVSRYYNSRGLVRGLTMGLIFFILMLIATMIFNYSLISFKSFFTNISICLVSGALGGIWGVGLSKK